jgi:hypothetical protein
MASTLLKLIELSRDPTESEKVTGVDIFPMKLWDQPDNLQLGCHDLNKRPMDPRIFQSRAYDLIHSRFIHQGMRTSRWAPYIENLKKLLRPGGWVQLMEYYPMVQSDSGLLTDQNAVRRWWAQYDACMTRLHRDPRTCRRFGELLTQAGYRDVAVDMEVLPIGGWNPGELNNLRRAHHWCREAVHGYVIGIMDELSIADRLTQTR